MPQANKKRGRRMKGEKRKHEDAEDDPALAESTAKRRKSSDAAVNHDVAQAAEHDQAPDGAYAAGEKAFFGMLDDEEQEYFKRADDMLESNTFGDDEERKLFLSNVYREAEGKELKIAQSQSCSRLMERLVQLSTPDQLKKLFQSFSGNFIHLVTHRFASHCCEALFLRSAPSVTAELLGHPSDTKDDNSAQNDNDQPPVSMESLFLSTLDELQGSVGYLLSDRYASHVLRILLLVLSGEPIDTASAKHLLQSKKKESNSVQGAEFADAQSLDKQRTVPNAFTEALDKLINGSIAGLDTEKVRALATHPNGNPVLQLLLRLELSQFGKQRAKDETSIIRTLLPDDPITAESGSAAFISGLVYDQVGSHLVERIVEHAPAKMFKSIYHDFFKERLVQHARNEVAAYVVCRVLERLGHDDLLDAHERLTPIISDLLRKDRTIVVRTLIERCTIRDIHTQAIAVQVDATWHEANGFDIKKLVKFEQNAEQHRETGSTTPQDSLHPDSSSTETSTFARPKDPTKTHFNILAQAMLLVPGSLSALVLDSLTILDSGTLLRMSKDHIVSRTLQAALTTRNASMITLRKLIQHFYGHAGEMALDSGASHVVDCIWEGTHGLAFIRERIAEELAENEAQLRESAYGRAVWKNWKMDLYKRRRGDWVKQSKMKASNDGFQSFAELDMNKDKDISAKTPLQLARERHAKAKVKKDNTNNRRPQRPLETAESATAAT